MIAAPRLDAFVFFGAANDPAYKQIFPALRAGVQRGRLGLPIIWVAISGRAPRFPTIKRSA